MNDNEYPKIRLRRTDYGYETKDGRYVIVRDTYCDIGSSNAGCYKTCWHVYRQSTTGERIAKFLDSLGEARVEVACDIETRRDQHPCRHGIDN